MKQWIIELCPEIAEWQADLIAEECEKRVKQAVLAQGEPTCKQDLQVPTVKESLTVQCWVTKAGQFSFEPQDERYWTRMVPAPVNQALLEALKEAVEDIEAWAGYASDYFRNKHDLQGTLEKHRAAIAQAEGKV